MCHENILLRLDRVKSAAEMKFSDWTLQLRIAADEICNTQRIEFSIGRDNHSVQSMDSTFESFLKFRKVCLFPYRELPYLLQLRYRFVENPTTTLFIFFVVHLSRFSHIVKKSACVPCPMYNR
jgi:hypothetical protein